MDTHEFRSSHGRAPRGHGSWAFFFGLPVSDGECWFPPGGPMLFSVACRLARVEAAQRRVSMVRVGP